MKFTVERACGHTETINVRPSSFDETAERASVCEACWRAQRDAQNQAIAQRNAAAGLPKLEGTPKQISWAETIRARIIERAQSYVDEARSYGNDMLVRQYQIVIERLRQQRSAQWWINHRDGIDVRIIWDARKEVAKMTQEGNNDC